jgi:type I restriction enzyme S subunit
MSNSFRLGQLSELIDFKNGKATRPDDGNIPIYGGNGVLGYSSEHNFSDTLIIGRVGAYCGSVHIEKGKCWVSDNAIAGVPKPTSDNVYNYYLLTSLGLNKKQVGSSQPLLTQGILNNIKVRIEFDINKQRELARVLEALDAKIELNNRINAELEAMAKTLYDYWFVQYDFPFDFALGKPDANGKPYKTSGGKMVYDPILKREIPDGWEVTKIGKIAKTVLGGTPDTGIDEYWKNADIPWLSSAEIASFPVITSEQKTTQKGIENSAATLLPKGTVVISIVRYIRPSILGIDAATNQSVVGIKECPRLKSSFIYPYFCSEVPRLMGLRTGAQQPHINKGTIENSFIVLPPDDILERYYEIATPIYEQVMNLAFQSYELIKLRDWLLPMLMNGQVTVRR